MKKIFTLSLILIVLASQAQNIKRVIKQVEKDDIAKARELCNKILDDESANPAANFMLAWMAMEGKAYFDAYQYILTYKQNEPSLDAGDQEELMAFLEQEMTRTRKKPFDFRVNKVYTDIEEGTINYVREMRDPALANQYMEKFPKSPYIENTKHIRNHYAFDKAKQANTIEALNEFVREYPDAAQIDMAKSLIQRLEFEQAKKSNTTDAFNGFIDKYPGSSFRTEALLLRNQIAFEEAKRMNSLEAIERFIRDYPNALQLAEAKKIKQKLVFEKAKKVNTIEAYTDFVKRYPFGKYYVDIFNLKAKALGNRIAENSAFKATQMNRAYDYNKTPERYTAAAFDPNGNIYLAGTINFDTVPGVDVWLLKINNQGKMIWNKRFGSPANDKIESLFIKDGKITGIGTYGATDSTPGKAWILNVKESGEKDWMKLMNDFQPIDAIQNDNGNLLVGGFAGNDSARNMLLIKFDADGNKIWRRDYVKSGQLNSIAKDQKGGVVFCGGNWICHVDKDGYIVDDQMTDTSINLVDIIFDGESALAAGTNDENILMIYDAPGKKMVNTAQEITKVQVLPSKELLVLGSNGSVSKLSQSGTFVEDVAINIVDFEQFNNCFFYTGRNTILNGNICFVKQ